MILTRQDLSDEENLRRCRHELVKACDARDRIGMLAVWAEEWGEAALEALENPEVDDDALKEAEEDVNKAEERVSVLSSAIRGAINKMEDADDGLGVKALGEIINTLETALYE